MGSPKSTSFLTAHPPTSTRGMASAPSAARHPTGRAASHEQHHHDRPARPEHLPGQDARVTTAATTSRRPVDGRSRWRWTAHSAATQAKATGTSRAARADRGQQAGVDHGQRGQGAGRQRRRAPPRRARRAAGGRLRGAGRRRRRRACPRTAPAASRRSRRARSAAGTWAWRSTMLRTGLFDSASRSSRWGEPASPAEGHGVAVDLQGGHGGDDRDEHDRPSPPRGGDGRSPVPVGRHRRRLRVTQHVHHSPGNSACRWARQYSATTPVLGASGGPRPSPGGRPTVCSDSAAILARSGREGFAVCPGEP